MEKIPMSAAPMSRYTMEAHLGLHLKNEQKTKFKQLRVNFVTLTSKVMRNHLRYSMPVQWW